MFGNSDNNRSQDQGGCREALSTKEGGGKSTAAGTRTGSEAAMRAMSVLANAKSNGHQKTHPVEPGGTGLEFTHLTRGGLRRERVAGVSRGRSSEESRGNPEGAKGRRDGVTRIDPTPRLVGREGLRNDLGVTTTVATWVDVNGTGGWNPVWTANVGAESGGRRQKGNDERG